MDRYSFLPNIFPRDGRYKHSGLQMPSLPWSLCLSQSGSRKGLGEAETGFLQRTGRREILSHWGYPSLQRCSVPTLITQVSSVQAFLLARETLFQGRTFSCWGGMFLQMGNVASGRTWTLLYTSNFYLESSDSPGRNIMPVYGSHVMVVFG